MVQNVLLFLFLVCIVVGGTVGKTKDECKKYPGVDIDAKKVVKVLREGWYFPMMKDITLKPNEWFERIPNDDRIWLNTECATLTSVSPFGAMKLEVLIKYNKTELFRGTLKNKSGATIGDVSKVSMYADSNIVMADPELKEYMVTTYCLFGREPYWSVVSPKKTLSPTSRKKILDYLVKLGFRRDGVEDSSSATLKPYKMQIVDCNQKNSVGGDALNAFA